MCDKDIIAMLEGREEAVLKLIEQEYGNYIKTIAFRVVHREEDVEECLNDSLLKIWNTIPPLVPQSFKAYLGTVARNIALDTYRKEHSEKRKGEFSELLEELQQCQQENPESIAEQQEISRSIDKYLGKVSKEKRFLFLARYYYGYSIEELCKKQQSSESKVKSTLFRMRKELKKQLEKDGVWE